MNELHLFTGVGGGILGGQLLGHTCVCGVEIELYCRRVLLQRQRDGIFPKFPIWDDVRTFDGNPWRGRVDIVCGGFPCTDISPARSNNRVNGKIRGIQGKSSGLWSEMRRIIGEIQPAFAFIENSPQLRTRGLVRILKDLNAMGYDARWCVLGAGSIGADHYRNRMFILAHSNRSQRQGGSLPSRVHQKDTYTLSSNWGQDQPGMERVAHGMANWSHRLKAIGNGQIPIVAAIAFQALIQGL